MNNYTSFDLWRAWVKSFDLRGVDVISCLSVIAACIVAGLLTLKVPVHRAYHRARIKTVTTRLGSSYPGALLFVELADGRSAALATRLMHQELAPGAEICVQELTDQLRGGTWFQHATAQRCLTQATAG